MYLDVRGALEKKTCPKPVAMVTGVWVLGSCVLWPMERYGKWSARVTISDCAWQHGFPARTEKCYVLEEAMRGVVMTAKTL